MRMPVTGFEPVLARWFIDKFGHSTDVQNQAWPLILAGKHTLISAPTGSGKTLAALLPLLDIVLKEKLRAASATQGYERGVRILYVTPLKALNNDIHQHLFDYIGEMGQIALQLGEQWPGVTVGIRTGDTSQSTRASMLRRPPDVLVTTPESLYILLTSLKARETLRSVRHVIVDEIHDLAGGERGMHLSLSLERLTSLCGKSPQRIGVSATQKPPERIAQYLGGWEHDEGASGDGRDHRHSPRPVEIVISHSERLIDLQVTMPPFPVVSGKNKDVWTPLIGEILRHIEGGGTSIIFVASRRLSERLSARLNEMVGEGFSRSHHGSVSREKRLETEQLLRAGKLTCLVATSSLELGIDVGYIEHVLQIDSPLSAASGIQRIGRSGHAVGGTSRGTIIVRNRGSLPEIAVLSERIARRDTEEIQVPRFSMGVLAQQIVAIVATADYTPDELYQLILRSDCYAGYPYDRYLDLLEMLSGLYPSVRPLIVWDRVNQRLTKRANTGMAAVMGAGTIPQSTGYPVYHADTRMHLGELDEEFIFESRAGDVFQLGATAWRIRSIRADRVEAVETDAAVGEIPFWRADGIGRSYELSLEIGEFVERLETMIDEHESAAEGTVQAVNWIMAHSRFTAEAAESLIRLLRAQRAVSAWPTHKRVIIEWFEDESGLVHVVFHSWFGRRFNRTWLMALQQHLGNVLPHSFESHMKDNGFELIFRQWDPSWLELLSAVHSSSIESLLLEAIPTSALFSATFRKMAETSLLLSRSFKRAAGWLKRLRGQELMRDVMPLATKFPLIKESLRTCMEELLDLNHVRTVLQGIEAGSIELRIVHAIAPSPLSAQFFYEFLNTAIYESDALTQDLQQRMLSVSRDLAVEVFGSEAMGQVIDEDVLAEAKVHAESGGQLALSDPGSLLRLLKERGDVTEEQWRTICTQHIGAEELLAALIARNEAAQIKIGESNRWISADEVVMYEALSESVVSRTFILGRYVETVVGFTANDLIIRYSLSREIAAEWIAGADNQRLIVPAPFAEAEEVGKLWTGAKAASRLIKRTLTRARGVRAEAARYCELLMNKQHVTMRSKLQGADGLLAVLEQLQGIYLPLAWWESIVLPARLQSYRQDDLDLLCASGEIFWLGRKLEGEKDGKVAFFCRDSEALYAPWVRKGREEQPQHSELYALLQGKGASFLSSLSGELGEPPTELMPKLLDLVWQGLVANDQFAPLRMHGANVKLSTSDRARFRSGLGRWYAVRQAVKVSDVRMEEREKSVLAWAKHLIGLNGMITRSIAAEQSPYSWDTLTIALGRMEDWGLVTRGLFVHDVPFMQYASKEAAEQLRRPLLHRENEKPSRRSTPGHIEGEHLTLLSAIDPANPYGSSINWPESVIRAAFARKPGNYLLFDGGEWILWIENKGRRLVSLKPDLADERFIASFIHKTAGTLLREHGLRKFVIETWNGQPIGESRLAAELSALGAERDRNAYVFWPSSL
jgi:ATP-dependent Lhr-like helicase